MGGWDGGRGGQVGGGGGGLEPVKELPNSQKAPNATNKQKQNKNKNKKAPQSVFCMS